MIEQKVTQKVRAVTCDECANPIPDFDPQNDDVRLASGHKCVECSTGDSPTLLLTRGTVEAILYDGNSESDSKTNEKETSQSTLDHFEYVLTRQGFGFWKFNIGITPEMADKTYVEVYTRVTVEQDGNEAIAYIESPGSPGGQRVVPIEDVSNQPPTRVPSYNGMAVKEGETLDEYNERIRDDIARIHGMEKERELA